MKTYIISILFLSFFLYSCKNEPKTSLPPALENSKDLNAVKKTTKASFNYPNNQVLYSNYLAIKAAMVNTSGTKTEDAAKKLVEDLKTDEKYQLIRQIASLISSTTDIKKQREFFVGLTEETLKILQKDLNSGQIFLQYCPMAFEGEGGYWLSNSSEIRNPYFGDIMLACGEVSKVLK